MVIKENFTQSSVPEISYDLGIADRYVAEFSAKVMDELMKAMDQLQNNREADIVVGGFLINTLASSRDGLYTFQATQRILENLMHAARLCGVRVMSPEMPKGKGGRIEDYELAMRIMPTLEKKLSPSALVMYQETLPKIKDLLEKTRQKNEAEAAQLQANYDYAVRPTLLKSIGRMLLSYRVIAEVPDTAKLPVVGIEVVSGRPKLGKLRYELKAFPAEDILKKQRMW